MNSTLDLKSRVSGSSPCHVIVVLLGKSLLNSRHLVLYQGVDMVTYE